MQINSLDDLRVYFFQKKPIPDKELALYVGSLFL